MLTRPQWEPTRLIPLKACLRRANARVKWCHNTLFLPTPSHFRLLLEIWKRNFCLRHHSPINVFVHWLTCFAASCSPKATKLQSVQDILQPHPAAAPAPISRSAHETFGDVPLKIQLLLTMPEASRATCSTVTSLVFQCEELFWRGENVDFEYWLVRMWAGGQSGHPSLRGVYAKSTRSLRLFQVSPGRNLVKHSSVPGIPVTNKQSMNEPGAFEPFGPQLSNTMRL